MSPSLTLFDIAKKLGVGKSTVQRALSNDPRCNKKTAEHVKAMAEKLGYRPDPVFAAMGSRRTRRTGEGISIAYLVDHGKKEAERTGVVITDMLAARAVQLGYKIELINLATWDSPRRLWNILYARGFAGVLVGSLRGGHRELLLANDRFPVVCVGRGDQLPFNTVRPAMLSAVREAWDCMTARGYRRIGAAILQHAPMVEDDFSRLSGVLGCQALMGGNGADAIPPLLDHLNGPSTLSEWVRKHRPDAVLAFHAGQYYTLRSAGFKIPRDMGFACLHNNLLHPEVTDREMIAGVSQNFPVVARSAVNLLDQMIRHGERGVPADPITITVQSCWSDGRSLPAKAETRKPCQAKTASA
ncbi:MAG: LacI family transcriptional regulator [Rariglobus sp.]|nr:LacI family transcriptional regulator [Rariglobus sp.]